MAVCRSCGFIHYNKEECPNCGYPTEYDCWNCGEYIYPPNEIHCRKCGWFVCPTCGECGCNPEAPKSFQKRGFGWSDDDL